MKLWIAWFLIDTGVDHINHTLIISAEDYSQAKQIVYKWEQLNCQYEDVLCYNTLHIDELDASNARVVYSS